MKYNPNEFITKITTKVNIKDYKCPFCGGTNFTTPENYSTLPVSTELDNVVLGPHIPAGTIICQNCGHIDFFALKVLNIGNIDEIKDKK